MKRIYYITPLLLVVTACTSDPKGEVSEERQYHSSELIDAAGESASKRDHGTAFDLLGTADVEIQGSGPAALAPSEVSSQVISAAKSGKIIRTGQASVEVKSIETAVARLTAVTEQAGGYVSRTETQMGDKQSRYARVELKIPTDVWQSAVSGLSQVGKVMAMNTATEDVGEEMVDLESRIRTAKAFEDRLLEMLNSRTGKLTDVMEVERELARIRQEMERYQGRLRYLETRVAISTLTVTLHEKEAALGIPTSPGETPIRDALKGMYRNMVYTIAGMIKFVGSLLPILLGGYLFVRLVRFYRRRRREKRSSR